MNINDFNIGIEIEYIGGRTDKVTTKMNQLGLDTQLVPYSRCHADHRGWIVTSDQTVSRNICYTTGVADGGEVVSPKLKYLDALEQVTKACHALNSTSDVSVNRNCGLHISLSWPNMNPQQVRRMLARYKKHERDIDAFMPSSRRASRNRWCGSLDASWVSNVVNGQGDHLSQLREGGKHYKVNLQNLGTGPRSRIEFRHHGGTTDDTKIKNWIKFLCNFVIAAQKSDALATRYRATKPSWFADIREQLDNVGISTKWSRALAVNGANGMTFHAPNGQKLEGLTFEQIKAFYLVGADKKGRGATLTPAFLDFAKLLCQRADINATCDRGLYNGIPTQVEDFYRARAEHFNNPHND